MDELVLMLSSATTLTLFPKVNTCKIQHTILLQASWSCYYKLDYSMSQATASLNFLQILKKKYPYLSRSTIEINLKRKSNISSLILYDFIYFYPQKSTWTKTNFLQRFKMGNVCIFYPLRITRNTSHNFLTLSCQCFHVCCKAKSP